MWLLPILAAVVAAPAVTPIVLPPEIKHQLDQEYPGWKLAPVSAAVQKEFAKKLTNRLPSLTFGDFDRNGKRDYAIQIALTTVGQEEQIVIIFMAEGNTYAENIVQSMGIDPETYILAQNLSLSETGPDAAEIKVKKDVLLVLGSPAGDTTYTYDNGRFIELVQTRSL